MFVIRIETSWLDPQYWHRTDPIVFRIKSYSHFMNHGQFKVVHLYFELLKHLNYVRDSSHSDWSGPCLRTTVLGCLSVIFVALLVRRFLNFSIDTAKMKKKTSLLFLFYWFCFFLIHYWLLAFTTTISYAHCCDSIHSYLF